MLPPSRWFIRWLAPSGSAEPMQGVAPLMRAACQSHGFATTRWFSLDQLLGSSQALSVASRSILKINPIGSTASTSRAPSTWGTQELSGYHADLPACEGPGRVDLVSF